MYSAGREPLLVTAVPQFEMDPFVLGAAPEFRVEDRVTVQNSGVIPHSP